MKKLPTLFLIVISQFSCTQNSGNLEIINSMQEQVTCWNNGDIDCFMETYWKSDSLKFISKDGITYGWKKTLDRYKTKYPDKAHMGVLSFDILVVEELGNDAVHVVGKWFLKREKGDVGGHFTLLWKQINGKWVIISDHTS